MEKKRENFWKNECFIESKNDNEKMVQYEFE